MLLSSGLLWATVKCLAPTLNRRAVEQGPREKAEWETRLAKGLGFGARSGPLLGLACDHRALGPREWPGQSRPRPAGFVHRQLAVVSADRPREGNTCAPEGGPGLTYSLCLQPCAKKLPFQTHLPVQPSSQDAQMTRSWPIPCATISHPGHLPSMKS